MTTGLSNLLRSHPVIVIGAGNAGLCAAISARQEGADVLVVEKAAIEHRGGNSALTANMRFAYDSFEDLLGLIDPDEPTRAEVYDRAPQYSVEEFIAEIMTVNNNQSNAELAKALAVNSLSTVQWLRSLGHKWVVTPNPIAGSIPLSLRGAGRNLQQTSFEVAEKMGVRFLYGCQATDLGCHDDGSIANVRIILDGASLELPCSAVILTSGGFEANEAMRSENLGRQWRNVRIRGVPYNTGDGLTMAIAIGAGRSGNWNACHATPQSNDLPDYCLPDLVSSTRIYWRYAFPFGITVNKEGSRFFDEGASFRNVTYARFGEAIINQPDQVAYQIFDEQVFGRNLLEAACYSEGSLAVADTLAELAVRLGVDRERFVRTIDDYNGAVRTARDFNPSVLDGLGTVDLIPPKSNWATRINVAPYRGCPVVCGLTFTYGGLLIDSSARVLKDSRQPIKGLFCAGEMVGDLFVRGYPGGSGLMAGAVFGRIAGKNAARLLKGNQDST